ncbi:MAG TPA: transketolase [Clostridiaceae bacterium]|nr:transketolase [Clostridiaceae bacterium]
MAEKIATREAYGKALVELGEKNKNIVVLDADLSKSTKTANFAKKFPERFFDMGISEADMMTTAAGFATCGKIPFASTFAIFATGRAYEQVRNSICYPKLNVKIAATHSGITVGEDGATHQSVEDLSLMRSIPNMCVICPADAVETRAAIFAAVDYKGPVYIRLGRLSVPVIYDENNFKFELGKSILVKGGKDLTIIAVGIMVAKALEAALKLKEEGIDARVIDMHTIKPVDKEAIVKAAKETGAIVTCEEHSIIGGLGSAVAEVLSEEAPVFLKRIGIEDKFGQSGAPDKLMELYGLTSDRIADESRKILKRLKTK